VLLAAPMTLALMSGALMTAAVLATEVVPGTVAAVLVPGTGRGLL